MRSSNGSSHYTRVYWKPLRRTRWFPGSDRSSSAFGILFSAEPHRSSLADRTCQSRAKRSSSRTCPYWGWVLRGPWSNDSPWHYPSRRRIRWRRESNPGHFRDPLRSTWKRCPPVREPAELAWLQVELCDEGLGYIYHPWSPGGSPLDACTFPVVVSKRSMRGTVRWVKFP